MASDERPALELRASPPDHQRRWTVFFRALLALPHFVVLGLLSYAAVVASILGWFAVLFTGRNPLQRFIVGYLRWHARVYAYAWLLTDCYPPFSVEADEKYPVDVTLEPGPVSRATAFFRLILAVPAYLVVACLLAGAGVFVFVGWVVTLLRGSLPAPLHHAFHASLRFALRTEAYLLLAQHRYPRGLFGEKTSAAEPSADTLALTSSDEHPALVEQLGDTAPTPSREASDEGASAPETRDVPRMDAVVTLTPGARRVLIGQLATGVVVMAAYIVVLTLVASSLSSGRLWYDTYGGRVSTIQLTVSTTITDVTASSPNWSRITDDCAQVESALAAIARVPQYPIARPNRDLLAGVADITVADHACVANIAPGHLTRYLPALAQAFGSGYSHLEAFTNAVP